MKDKGINNFISFQNAKISSIEMDSNIDMLCFTIKVSFREAMSFDTIKDFTDFIGKDILFKNTRTCELGENNDS